MALKINHQHDVTGGELIAIAQEYGEDFMAWVANDNMHFEDTSYRDFTAWEDLNALEEVNGSYIEASLYHLGNIKNND